MRKNVKVTSITDEQGMIEPRKIMIGSKHWPVKMLKSRPTSLRKRQSTILVFEISIPISDGQYHTKLYYEIPDLHSVRPRWFVEAKEQLIN